MLPGDRGFIPNRSDRAKVTGIRSLRARRASPRSCGRFVLPATAPGERLKVEGQPAEHRFLVVFLPNKTVVEPRVSRQF